MLLSVWKFGTASGFYTQTKFGMEDLFLCCPAPRHGGSEILAVVKKGHKTWGGPGVLGRRLEGLCSAWASQHKGVGHPRSKLFLWHNRVTGLLFHLGAARNKFSVCPHQKLVNVNRGQVQYQFPMDSSISISILLFPPLVFPCQREFPACLKSGWLPARHLSCLEQGKICPELQSVASASAFV